MLPTRTLHELTFAEAEALTHEGAAFVDLRPMKDHLEVHIPGSLGIVYEFGPGMGARARDCLPLSLPLILMAAPDVDMVHAGATLRGRGFEVLGEVRNAVEEWAVKHGTPASTEQLDRLPEGTVALHVRDPGALPPGDALTIPAETLWDRTDELSQGPIAVVAGFGLRATLAVGILERAGIRDVSLLWARQGR